MGVHKKARKTKLKQVSEDLAVSVSKHLEMKIIPYSKICDDCNLKISNMIDSARHAETIPDCTSSGAECNQMIEKSFDIEEEMPKSDKEIILEKIKKQQHNYGKTELAAIISVLPSSWTNVEICEKTGIVERFVSAVRNGDVTTARKERKDKISDEVKEEIRKFYKDESNSKILPGIKDIMSVKTPDGRIKVRKQLLLSSISSAHEKFVAETGLDVSLEIFRQYRPENVVLVGASGTHSICCCSSCENPKLIISTSVLGMNSLMQFIYPHSLSFMSTVLQARNY